MNILLININFTSRHIVNNQQLYVQDYKLATEAMGDEYQLIVVANN